MWQNIKINNTHDTDDNEKAGSAKGNGIDITWHTGARWKDGKMEPWNGATVEDVIEIAKMRLEFFQKTKYSHLENGKAIACLVDALACLDRRRQERRHRGVEGKDEV